MIHGPPGGQATFPRANLQSSDKRGSLWQGHLSETPGWGAAWGFPLPSAPGLFLSSLQCLVSGCLSPLDCCRHPLHPRLPDSVCASQHESPSCLITKKENLALSSVHQRSEHRPNFTPSSLSLSGPPVLRPPPAHGLSRFSLASLVPLVEPAKDSGLY